ncbi:MAG: penicillin-binding protein 2, partial [Gammaproteobacteria bacterium]|nr:penicillin-binding protein 2 [Gammaproteobacteria bacterium]
MEKIGNIKREKVVFKSRVIFSAIIMLSITLVLIVRLFNLQITKHDYYVKEALGNQMQNLPITPIRGDILDRNGKILATNEFSYILTITPEKVINLNETLIGLEISDLITYEDIKKFNK